MFTADQITAIRVWVPWDPPDDTALHVRGDVLGTTSIFPVVIEQLRVQLSKLIAAPAQFSIVGDYSQNTGANIEALERQLAAAEAAYYSEQLEAGATGGTAQLVRYDPVRGTY